MKEYEPEKAKVSFYRLWADFKVIRDRKGVAEIRAVELVPGDIIEIAGIGFKKM